MEVKDTERLVFVALAINVILTAICFGMAFGLTETSIVVPTALVASSIVLVSLFAYHAINEYTQKKAAIA